ncbi:MAG: thiamine pyrophosphate-binding protein [Candidatus Aenigmarchaeota archaeon]|nr:thiamine pyrophosphate-binding protein [Candidatus Aenigmarchaeota archaeon]
MRLLEGKLQLAERFEIPRIYNGTGNTLVLDNFSGWGANLHFLTNGGGAVHVAEHLAPFRSINDLVSGVPTAFVINEIGAAYAAASHYLASRRIAVCDFTTGGAVHLVAPAVVDSKLHNVPVIYLGSLSASTAGDNAPLQDTGPKGFNTVGMMKEVLGDGCQVIDSVDGIERVLYNARNRLLDSKPVVILYHPDILSKQVDWFKVPWKEKPKQMDKKGVDEFLSSFPSETNGKRVVLFVGEEAAKYEGMRELTTKLARLLKAPTLYTQVGVSAVSPNNEFAAGYLMLGYNDFARKLWKNLTTDDTVICIGFDPFEYSTNQEKIKANAVVITNYNNPYGSVNDGFQHRVEGKYRHIKGDLELVVTTMIENLKGKYLIRPNVEVPKDLNEDNYVAPPSDFVNQSRFYKTFAELVSSPTNIIGDVCMGYKDFQRVTQRPISGVDVLYFHQGSLMGQGAGEALGIRFARPDKHIHLITGDGCFEYFGASLGRMKDLGLVFWVLDNGTHGLVSWGLSKIKPHISDDRKLTDVPRNDYVKMAQAQGWKAYELKPDLSNMEQIMKKANSFNSHSMLIRVPIYPFDDLGQNPRLDNLGRQGRQLNL